MSATKDTPVGTVRKTEADIGFVASAKTGIVPKHPIVATGFVLNVSQKLCETGGGAKMLHSSLKQSKAKALL